MRPTERKSEFENRAIGATFADRDCQRGHHQGERHVCDASGKGRY